MAAAAPGMKMVLLSPAGVLTQPAALTRATRRLKGMGFDVSVDPDARARYQRFAGDDATRLGALHRVARAAPSIALATRGGYGLTRLLDRIDWKLLGRSIDAGTRWVGQSDLTALQCGLLARGGHVTWAGPLACDHFGRTDEDGGVDELTQACFTEAMDGSLHALGFRCGKGFDGLDVRGTLWGGNLSVLMSLLGTPHWPKVKSGILFVEDVNEHPYRLERYLLQLKQTGALDAQRAVVLGHVSNFKPAPHDRGYTLKTMVDHLRSQTRTPILTGLPFGHAQTIVTLPVGARVMLATQGQEAFLSWDHRHG